MSEQVTKEQTKGAEQENITELTDQQLAEAQGGADTGTQSCVRTPGNAGEWGAPFRDPTRGHVDGVMDGPSAGEFIHLDERNID